MIADGACRCTAAGQKLLLLPEKAVYWGEQDALLVADIHLGKSAAFRSAGLGIPEGIAEDLGRLGEVLDRTGASNLLVLGDLFHAPEGQSATVRDSLMSWREARSDLDFVVTRGNHDRQCAELLEQCGIDFCATREIPPFVFEHEAAPQSGGYRVGGHIHPAVRLPDRTRSIRLPCFWFGEGHAVLPAFGGFTGTHVIDREEGDRVFAVTEDRVVAIGSRG